MTGLRPQRGFSATFPYWGFQQATPDEFGAFLQSEMGRWKGLLVKKP